MNANLLRISIAILIAFSYASPAFALEFYRQEANYGNQTIAVPSTLGYSFYSENASQASSANQSNKTNQSNQANAISSVIRTNSYTQTQKERVNSAKDFINRFLPKDNGQWFLVAMILVAMFLASKFLLKAKKKSEPKPEEKKSLPKIG